MIDNSKFCHLHTHTLYSLLDGIIRRGELIKQVKEMGLAAACVTEHGNMINCIEFAIDCKKEDVKPIIGIEAYVSSKSLNEEEKVRYNDHLLLIAKNRTGYFNLLKLTTLSFERGFYMGRGRIDYDLLKEYKEGVIISSACLAGRVSRLIMSDELDQARQWVEHMAGTYGEDFYIELIYNGWKEQLIVNSYLIDIANTVGVPMIVTNDVHYLTREHAYTQDVALAIQTDKPLKSAGRKMSIYDENGNPITDGYLKSYEEMLALDFPQEAYDNVFRIVNQIEDYGLEYREPTMPTFNLRRSFGPFVNITSRRAIESICKSNWLERVPIGREEEYAGRLAMELEVIDKLGFSDYFLIIWDIVDYCKRRGILTGPGRGSASGSLVVYMLGITEIDPIVYGLYFERFLNPERISPPDIDFDVEQMYRQEVIQYIKETYGELNALQIGTIGRMAIKDTINRVGKALGIELSTINRIKKEVNIDDGTKNHDMPELAKKQPDIKEQMDTINGDWWKYCDQLCNLPTSIGVHAAGVVIAPDGTDEIPRCLAGSKDSGTNVVSQFDMQILEKMGYVKFDLLGLKSLDVIHGTIDLIKESGDAKFSSERDIYNQSIIPLDDIDTYNLIGSGDTTGIFQLENEGFKGVCRNLKPETFQHVAALNALYRPGPIGSGVLDAFVQRRHGREPVIYDFPGLESATDYTFGLVLYQEQIMRLSMEVAGYSLPEADNLRKIIGKKLVEKIKGEGEKFIPKGVQYGKYPESDVVKAWEIIVPSGRYCVVGDTKVMLADGTYKTMKELVESKYDGEVWSFDENINFVKRKVIHWWDNGPDKMWRIKTKGGNEITCTADHDLLTDDGKKCIATGLNVGDSLCLINQPIDIEDTSILENHEVIGLAHIIAEGYLRKRKYKDGKVAYKLIVFIDFCTFLDIADVKYNSVVKHTRTGDVTSIVTNKSVLAQRIDDLGCDVLSDSKFIPIEVFKLNNKRLAIFIGRLYSGDGTISIGDKGARGVSYASKSETLIDQLRWLLACRFGIQAKKRLNRGRRLSTYIDDNGNIKQHKTKFKEIWNLIITDRTDIFKFYQFIGEYLIGYKKQILADICSVDIPNNGIKADLLWWDKYSEMVINGSNSRHYDRPGYAPKKYINRVTLMKHNNDYLIQNQNIRFDPIDSVEYIGEENSYCITVDETHSFIGNVGICTYQSWNLAHAVAYGYITYLMAYFKVHYRTPFYVASLNVSLGDAVRLSVLIKDAKELGVPISPPNVNLSDENFKAVGDTIVYGLRSINGIGEQSARAIIEERERNGAYEGIVDFISRVPSSKVNSKHRQALVKAGALDDVDPNCYNRATLFDAVVSLSEKRKAKKYVRATIEKRLKNAEERQDYGEIFACKNAMDGGCDDKGKYTIYSPINDDDVDIVPEWDSMTIYKGEIEALGTSLSVKIDDMFDIFVKWLNIKDMLKIEETKDKGYGWKFAVKGMITRVHKIITKKGDPMGFIEITDDSGPLDVTIFPDLWAATGDIKVNSSVIILCRMDLNKDKTANQVIAYKMIDLDKGIPVQLIQLASEINGDVLTRIKELGEFNHFSLSGGTFIVPTTGNNSFMITKHLGHMFDLIIGEWVAEVL